MARSFFPSVAACELFSCGMWDLVPRPGVKPEPPTLKVQRFSHWTIREAPRARFLESTSHNFVPSTWTLPSFWTPLLTFVSLTALLSIHTENLPLNLSVPPMKPLSSTATGLSPYHRAPHGLKTEVSLTWANTLTWTPFSNLIPSILNTWSSHAEFITLLQTPSVTLHLWNLLASNWNIFSFFIPYWKTLIHSSKSSSSTTSSGLSEILPGKVNLFSWIPLTGYFPI